MRVGIIEWERERERGVNECLRKFSEWVRECEWISLWVNKWLNEQVMRILHALPTVGTDPTMKAKMTVFIIVVDSLYTYVANTETVRKLK